MTDVFCCFHLLLFQSHMGTYDSNPNMVKFIYKNLLDFLQLTWEKSAFGLAVMALDRKSKDKHKLYEPHIWVIIIAFFVCTK